MLWPKRILDKVRGLRPGARVGAGAKSGGRSGGGLLCCPCVFRGRKAVAAGGMGHKDGAPVEAWATPVLSMIYVDDTEVVTKSPISSRTSSYKLSQDSLETHQLSSGNSSCSDNERHPGDSPYRNTSRVAPHRSATGPRLPAPAMAKGPETQPRSQPDMPVEPGSPTSLVCAPLRQSANKKRERFITLDSGSDNEGKDDEERRRNQVYAKLQDEADCVDPAKVVDSRLSKSHADLTDIRTYNRKMISSAPAVKHPVNPAMDDDRFQTTEEQPVVAPPPPAPTAPPPKPPSPPKPESIPKMPKIMPKRQSSLSRRDSFNTARHEAAPAVFPATLRRFPKSREGLHDTLAQLESPDWESTMRGLTGLVRLVRHHKDLVEGNMHSVCVLLGRHIKNLRSQVARAACAAAQEMFDVHKKALEPELEELTAPLLQRTADTNRFLRSDAYNALDTMSRHCSTGKVVLVLGLRGVQHHNSLVRCTAARLYANIIRRLGHEKFFQLPRETRDKMLRAGADMLTEGSLETRKYAKEMFSGLIASPHLQRSLIEAVPAATMRHISKIIASLK